MNVRGMMEQMKIYYQEYKTKSITKDKDMLDELNELKKVYEENLESLKKREAYYLDYMSHYMKDYVESRREKHEIECKLMCLNSKIREHVDHKKCDCDDE